MYNNINTEISLPGPKKDNLEDLSQFSFQNENKGRSIQMAREPSDLIGASIPPSQIDLEQNEENEMP